MLGCLPMKRLVLAFGALGLVGCFLPIFGDVSWFDLRHEGGSTVWLLIAAFATPTVVGVTRNRLGFADALAAVLGFGYALYRFHGDLGTLIFHTGIGGTLMAVAAMAGFGAAVLALLGTVIRDQARI